MLDYARQTDSIRIEGRTEGGPLMRGPHVLLVCLACSGAISVGGCDRGGPSSANTPQQMFAYVIQSPIPPGVTDLQGVGDTWQGYSLYLRFHATDATIDALIAKGYQPATWDRISWRFKLPSKEYDRFKPSWDPQSIVTKECYEADVSNTWTGSGSHYLVIDRSNGVVYFYGVGA